VLYCEGFVLVLRPGPGSILIVRESGDWVILLTLVTAIGQVGVDRRPRGPGSGPSLADRTAR
jgi:hypothetical protein